MKHVKMLGLAVVAAAALMAFVGVGTASATTTLCENGSSTTSCSSAVKTGTELDFSAEDTITLKAPLGIVIATCTESTVKGKTTNETGATVTGNITSLTFGNCGVRDVTANAATLGTLSIEHINGTDNGTVRSSDTTVTIKTIPSGLGIPETCNYLTSTTAPGTDIGTLTGSLVAPTFDISATIPSETAGCPNGTWSGHYSYTGTTPAIITG